MTFVSTGIKDDDDDYVLFGDLTINGVTRQVEFDARVRRRQRRPVGQHQGRLHRQTEINRKDLGLEWNVALETGGVLVGDKVKVQLDIQAAKA